MPDILHLMTNPGIIGVGACNLWAAISYFKTGNTVAGISLLFSTLAAVTMGFATIK